MLSRHIATDPLRSPLSLSSSFHACFNLDLPSKIQTTRVPYSGSESAAGVCGLNVVNFVKSTSSGGELCAFSPRFQSVLLNASPFFLE